MTPETFLEHIGVLAEIPVATKRLREMILELAVRGKLVPHNSAEEPALQMLERIRKSSSLKLNEAQRKIFGSVPPGGQSDAPYAVPSSWNWAIFSEVASIESHLVDPAEFGDWPHIAPDNIEKGTGRLLPYRTIRSDGVISGKHKFKSGQILYSKIRPNLSKVVIVDFKGLCSADMYPISAKIDTRYLQIFMLSKIFLDQVVRDDNRLAMPKVNQQQLAATLVPVPPVLEQKRIVAKVDQLMALCDELDAKQTRKRETGTKLTQSALNALTSAEGPEEFAQAWQRVAGNFEVLFDKPERVEELRRVILELAVRGVLEKQESSGESVNVTLQRIAASKKESAQRAKKVPSPRDGEFRVEPPFDVPNTWTWVRFEELAKRIEYGTSAKPTNDPRGLPLLRMNNLRGGKLVLDSLKYVPRETDGIGELLLEHGDILFNRTNSYELVGKTAVYLENSGGHAFASYLLRASLLTETASAVFLNFYFMTPVFRSTQLEPGIVQQNGQANFNSSKLRKVWVPFPPLAEQKRIVTKVNQLMTLCDELEAKLRTTEQHSERLAGAMAAAMVA